MYALLPYYFFLVAIWTTFFKYILSKLNQMKTWKEKEEEEMNQNQNEKEKKGERHLMCIFVYNLAKEKKEM